MSTKKKEQRVISVILLDNRIMHRIAKDLYPNDFENEPERTIFAAMRRVYAQHQPLDLVTLANELGAEGRLQQVGGPANLVGYIDQIPAGYDPDEIVSLAYSMEPPGGGRVKIELRLSTQHDDEDILATRVRNLLEQHLAFLKEHDANIGVEGRVVHHSGVVAWRRLSDADDEHREELP